MTSKYSSTSSIHIIIGPWITRLNCAPSYPKNVRTIQNPTKYRILGKMFNHLQILNVTERINILPSLRRDLLTLSTWQSWEEPWSIFFPLLFFYFNFYYCSKLVHKLSIDWFFFYSLINLTMVHQLRPNGSLFPDNKVQSISNCLRLKLSL